MLLLIPGPVMTHEAVRAAAARDFAPWDNDFRALVVRLRDRVLAIAGGRPGEHTTLLLQGCGHFAMEAACRTFIPPGGSLLLPKTGQYADRLERLAEGAGRRVLPMDVPQDRPIDPAALEAALRAAPDVQHVGLVYSETATGVCQDVPALAELVGRLGRRVIVDAVSALGALPLDIGALPMVDSVTFTSNKCLEGLPGFSMTVARVDRLEACVGQAQSWSFDLADMHRHYQQAPGAFRFTPPAGAVASFEVALDLFDREGRERRLARYTENTRVLYDGALRLGLRPCLERPAQGPIVVNIAAPPDPGWDLQRFVDSLKRRGVLISNFYNTPAPSFRVGCIGAVTPEQIGAAVGAIDAALGELRIRLRQAA